MVRLDEERYKALKARADSEDKSINQVINEAIDLSLGRPFEAKPLKPSDLDRLREFVISFRKKNNKVPTVVEAATALGLTQSQVYNLRPKVEGWLEELEKEELPIFSANTPQAFIAKVLIDAKNQFGEDLLRANIENWIKGTAMTVASKFSGTEVEAKKLIRLVYQKLVKSRWKATFEGEKPVEPSALAKRPIRPSRRKGSRKK